MSIVDLIEHVPGNFATVGIADSGTRTGIFFGTSSGVITTLGIIVGLSAGTESMAAVVGGILVIAVADSMSDALGIHLAQESDDAAPTRRDR